MNGQVVGATAPDDNLVLLRLAHTLGLLNEHRTRDLQVIAQSGLCIFSALLDELPTDAIDDLLLHRFYENLAYFVASPGTPEFTAQPAIFTNNMQLGHNPAQLVERACRTADLARSIPFDALIQPGMGSSSDPLEQQIIQRVQQNPTLIGAVVSGLPLETWAAKAVVANLIGRGVLQIFTEQVALTSPHSSDEEEDDDAPTVFAQNALLSTDDEEENVGDDLSFSAADRSMFMHTGSDISDEDMAFFEDHEHDRGAGQGGFSTESHNLDKVTVGESSDDDVIEADEAPSSKFSAPSLSEEDALAKIAVCNDVLLRVSAALDAAQGAGRGRAASQLLVEGAPTKFNVLLHDLYVHDNGELPAEDLLDNLDARPPGEHRHLLNSAMKSMIERMLSMAADELPDEAFDEVYEAVAGYNQRLGL